MGNKFGNAPLPTTFSGETLQQALHDYQTVIIGMFQDAADAGHPIKVHTVQIIAPGRDPINALWRIVAFIQEDTQAAMQKIALDAIAKGRQVIDQHAAQANCIHQYGEDMKCMHCGAVL